MRRVSAERGEAGGGTHAIDHRNSDGSGGETRNVDHPGAAGDDRANPVQIGGKPYLRDHPPRRDLGVPFKLENRNAARADPTSPHSGKPI